MRIKTILAGVGVAAALLAGPAVTVAGIAGATPVDGSSSAQQERPDRGPVYAPEGHRHHRHTPGGEIRHGRHVLEGKVRHAIREHAGV